MTEEAEQTSAPKPVELPLAQFTLVYVSKDGRLCLFEDGGGHLTAVRTERLA